LTSYPLAAAASYPANTRRRLVVVNGINDAANDKSVVRPSRQIYDETTALCNERLAEKIKRSAASALVRHLSTAIKIRDYTPRPRSRGLISSPDIRTLSAETKSATEPNQQERRLGLSRQWLPDISVYAEIKAETPLLGFVVHVLYCTSSTTNPQQIEVMEFEQKGSNFLH